MYEDALTILSYASPYDVELEVESGGTGSKPTTLLKKSVGPSPTRLCHPLYRSQSIPELSQVYKSSAKRLFIVDPNESLGSNYSTLNSTLKSSKSTPGTQTLERRHDEVKSNHHKLGIKVLPALDGTVHRIETQNEHNTNLERRNSRKMDVEKVNAKNTVVKATESNFVDEKRDENLQKRENTKNSLEKMKKLLRPNPEDFNGFDVADKGNGSDQQINIPSEVPAEVHNAAIAARRNRKSSCEQSMQKTTIESNDTEEPKTPQKSKRKAPAPPKLTTNDQLETCTPNKEASPPQEELNGSTNEATGSIVDCNESQLAKVWDDYMNKKREDAADRRVLLGKQNIGNRYSESDTDSEMHNNFTTIELNPADITIHKTEIPEMEDEDEDADDMYRKAASLGDLSKYESKGLTMLERAQSLDMTDSGSKKRKAPLPPEDINESTEDLSKIDQIDTFDRRKLKKSIEWGTLEDAIWNKREDVDDRAKKPRIRKKSDGTLERSKSSVEIKLKDDSLEGSDRLNVSDGILETSIELYNLPLSKRLTKEFIETERMFNPDEDNSLARIVNDGRIVKSPTPEEIELDFRQARPLPDEDDFEQIDLKNTTRNIIDNDLESSAEVFSKKHELPVQNESSMYAGRKEVIEEPITKVTVSRECPGCNRRHHGNSCPTLTDDKGSKNSAGHEASDNQEKSSVAEPVPEKKRTSSSSMSDFQLIRSKFMEKEDQRPPSMEFETHYAKRIVNIVSDPKEDSRESAMVDEAEDGYDFGPGSITVNSKTLSSPSLERRNVSNVSVSSGENSEDSGLVREPGDYLRQSTNSTSTTPLPPLDSSQKMTYITEIKVSTSQENLKEDSDNEEIVAIMGPGGMKKQARHEVTVMSNGKPTPSKKPPEPPKRNDSSKGKDSSNQKQVVYVSEYKSIPKKDNQLTDVSTSNEKHNEAANKFEQWIYLEDKKEHNPWENKSNPPQTVTNIVLTSADEKIIQQ